MSDELSRLERYRAPSTVMASDADKQAAEASGLPTVWHQRDGELKPFVPLDAYQGAVSLLREIADSEPTDDPALDAHAMRIAARAYLADPAAARGR